MRSSVCKTGEGAFSGNRTEGMSLILKCFGKGSLGVAPGDKDDVAIALSHSETLQTSSTFEHIVFALARASLNNGTNV